MFIAESTDHIAPLGKNMDQNNNSRKISSPPLSIRGFLACRETVNTKSNIVTIRVLNPISNTKAKIKFIANRMA